MRSRQEHTELAKKHAKLEKEHLEKVGKLEKDLSKLNILVITPLCLTSATTSCGMACRMGCRIGLVYRPSRDGRRCRRGSGDYKPSTC